MGRDIRRPARPDEIARMRELVRTGMRDGAWGLSAGLEYAPGRWSTTDEVVALAEEVAPYHGMYISHERAEGADPMWYWPSQDSAGPPNLLDAVRASCAMPGLFTPMIRENVVVVDGGLVNPVPVSMCRALGAEAVIAIDLSWGKLGPYRDLIETVRGVGYRFADETAS